MKAAGIRSHLHTIDPHVELDVEYATHCTPVPSPVQLRAWVRAAIASRRDRVSLTIRIVDEEEAFELNRRWRNAQKATNVLAFPCSGLEAIMPAFLGDVVLCAPVVAREAAAQHKGWGAHWAHLVIHGTLHLLGFDHAVPAQATEMEEVERAVLQRLGYSDPYLLSTLQK
ncbi:MAG: rRNA maturation RNase YbeY [Gammaproteobacteria bacterium]